MKQSARIEKGASVRSERKMTIKIEKKKEKKKQGEDRTRDGVC